MDLTRVVSLMTTSISPSCRCQVIDSEQGVALIWAQSTRAQSTDNETERNFGEGRMNASRLLRWLISLSREVVFHTAQEWKSGVMSASMMTDIKWKGEGQTEETEALCFHYTRYQAVYYSSFKGSFFKALTMFWCQMIETLQLVFHPVEKITLALFILII